MPVEGVYSVEEQRALVYEYLSLPYGTKGQFLAEQGVSYKRFDRWRAQVLADTLNYGLVPRAGMVSMADGGAVKRLLEENQKLREQLADRDVEHQRELEARDEELARQRRAVDALGKAIEILHPSGASKNSSSTDADPDTPPQQA